MSDEPISKSDFARVVGVTPGRVTQWISEEKIDGEALVGSGRDAKICVAVAVGQLRERLDVNNRARASAKAQLDGIASAPVRPVISEAQLGRLASKLSDAFLQVLRREFNVSPDGASLRLEPAQADPPGLFGRVAPISSAAAGGVRGEDAGAVDVRGPVHE
jgi:hypothetical protein